MTDKGLIFQNSVSNLSLRSKFSFEILLSVINRRRPRLRRRGHFLTFLRSRLRPRLRSRLRLRVYGSITSPQILFFLAFVIAFVHLLFCRRNLCSAHFFRWESHSEKTHTERETWMTKTGADWRIENIIHFTVNRGLVNRPTNLPLNNRFLTRD